MADGPALFPDPFAAGALSFPGLPRRRRRRALTPLGGPVPKLGVDEAGPFRRAVSSGLGGLGSVLDFLNRGNFAVAGGVDALLGGLQQGESGDLVVPKDVALRDVVSGVWRGLSGKDKVTFGKILAENRFLSEGIFNVQPGAPASDLRRISRGLAGFALDVGTDPLTWIGFGAVGKLGKGKPIGRALLRVGGYPVIKQGGRAGRAVFSGLDKISDVWRASRIGRVFTTKLPRYASGTQDLIQRHRDLGRYLGGQNLEQDLALAKKLVAGLDSVDDLLLADSIEFALKHSPESIPAGARPAAEGIRVALESRYQSELAAGIPTPRLGGNVWLRESLGAVDDLNTEIAKLRPAVVGGNLERSELADLGSRLSRLEARKASQISAARSKMPDLVERLGTETFEDIPGALNKLDAMEAAEIDYLPHIMTPEFRKFYGKHVGPSMESSLPVEFSPWHRSMEPRSFVVPGITGRHPTLGEIERAASGGSLSIRVPGQPLPVTIPKGMRVLEHDPFLGLAIRGQRNARSITGKRFRDALASAGSESPTEIRRFQLDADAFPEAAGRWFGLEERDAISKAQRAFFSDDVTQGIAGTIKRITSGWRQGQLLIYPKYHMRNFVGNVFNNGLADPALYSPKPYLDAMSVMYRVSKDGVDALDTVTREMWVEASKRGVVGSGLYATEAGSALRSQVEDITGRALEGRVKGALLKVPRKAFKTGRAVGTVVEDSGRLAHFMVMTKKGYSWDEAAASVKKYLFDYNDLTDIERNIFREVFPFYTWTRKNLPLQLEGVLTKPGRYAAIGKAKTSIEGSQEGPGLQTHLLPSYLQGLPLRVSAGKKQRVINLGQLLPTGELEAVANIAAAGGKIDPFAPLSLITEALHPAVKLPVELSTGRSLYGNFSVRGREGRHIAESAFRGIGEVRRARSVYEAQGAAPALLSQLLASPTEFNPVEAYRSQKKTAQRNVRRYNTMKRHARTPEERLRIEETLKRHQERLRQILARRPGG